MCRTCHSAAGKAWAELHPMKRKNISRNSWWKRMGILNADGSIFTVVDYDQAYQIQQGRCKGCDKHQSELNQSLHADHNHETGMFRFLLCGPCNRTLGLVYDKPKLLRRLADLLESL